MIQATQEGTYLPLFDRALNRIEENLQKEFNCIPLKFERLSNIVPGIMQKTYYCVTANSGIGKSQFTDSIFLYDAYDFVKNNPELGINLKIEYWSLEMDAETKYIQGVCRRLKTLYNINVGYNDILSMSKNRISQEIVDKITECRDYFLELQDILTIHDNPMNPYGIYKRLYSIAEDLGTIYKERKVDEKTGDINEFFSHYTFHNPNTYVINITDHLALLEIEKDANTTKLAMEKHSKNMRRIRNMFGFTPVDVQQQGAETEKQEYYRGSSVESKLIPSLSGLGDSKLTARNFDIVFGVFAPDRYEIKNWGGYDISKIKDFYRALYILKYRFGTPNIYTNCYFNGESNIIKELPKDLEEQNNFMRAFMANPKF
jgi:hypothetical protein